MRRSSRHVGIYKECYPVDENFFLLVGAEGFENDGEIMCRKSYPEHDRFRQNDLLSYYVRKDMRVTRLGKPVEEKVAFDMKLASEDGIFFNRILTVELNPDL